MRSFLVCLLLAVALVSSGCAITHDSKAAVGIKEAGTINIIQNPSVRAGFLEAMKEWLTSNGYKYNVLPQNADKSQGWVLTYIGQWSWDLTIYLAKASIKAYKDGVEVGNSEYSSTQGGLNLNKFSKADETIKKMMTDLFK